MQGFTQQGRHVKGQTTLDFVIGIVIFLAVILFVFGFVPGILEPFAIAGEEEPAHSDRIANGLAQDKLGSPDNPYVLDRYCTVEFFTGEEPADCNFEATNLEDRFGLATHQNVNVTLEGSLDPTLPDEQLCWSEPPDSEPGLAQGDDCNGEDATTFAIGQERPTDGGTTITSRRVVSLHGEPVTLRVVVW